MNYFVLGMIVITVLPILIGIIMGLIRGIKRSVARIVTIVVCAVIAGLLCGVVGNAVVKIEIEEGVTVLQYMCDMVTEAMQGVDLSQILVPFVQGIVNVIVFVLLFAALLFLTWIIVAPICNAIIRRGEKRKVKPVKKHRLIGSLLGAVQGFAVAIVVCMALSGLLTNLGKLSALASDVSGTVPETAAVQSESAPSEEEPAPSEEGALQILDMLAEYGESGVAKFYNGLTSKPFQWLTTVTTEEGEKTNLPDLVDGLCGASEMAKEMIKLGDFDFEELLRTGEFDELDEIFARLDEIKNGMSDGSLKTLDILLNSLSDAFDLPVDLASLDIGSVEFIKEGEVIHDLYYYTTQNSLTVADAENIVKKVGESQLILPVVESVGSVVADSLTDEQSALIQSALENIEQQQTLSPDKIESLHRIFG